MTDFNKELYDEKFCEVHKKLDLILAQTIKTNGSVKSLQLWRSYIIGALSVMGVVGVLVAYIWNSQVNSVNTQYAILNKQETNTANLIQQHINETMHQVTNK